MNSATSRRILIAAVAVISLFSVAGTLKAIEKTTSVEGVVTRIDRAAKTITIKVADGTEHTMHLVEGTVVHAEKETYRGAEGAARDLQEGAQVVVHYTQQGTDETAEEIDHIGKDGLRASEGTITNFDRGARTMTIKSADGTKETYRLTEHVIEEAGKDTEDVANSPLTQRFTTRKKQATKSLIFSRPVNVAVFPSVCARAAGEVDRPWGGIATSANGTT